MTSALRVKGCCPLDCQDSCAWVAHVEDGRVVRVEGSRDHPITRGVLCAKTSDYETRTYSPDRILHPLRRVGPKGSGRFERIAWDEALDEIAQRFGSIVRDHGGEALLPFNYLGSMGVVQRRALMRLFHALGASRFHGSVCGASGNALEAEGHPRGVDPEDMVESRLILVWGVNVLTTCHHQWHFMKEAKRLHGTRIVCIDPRRTKTAAAADAHLQIRPGSDAALAAGIAHVMWAEGLVDADALEDVVEDVEAHRRAVAEWPPERAAEECGVTAREIVDLAREFAAAKPALIRGGVGPQQTVGGEDFVRSLSALALIGGHWGRRGGGLFIETNPVIDETRASRPDLSPRETRSLDIARLGDTLLGTGLASPVRGLMVWGANPAATQPDAERVRSGLLREDLFTVVIEHFLTDTARHADIVLPSTTQLEHFDVQGAWGHQYVLVNERAVPPMGEAKSHGEIMRLLAARMGLTLAALRESDEDIAASVLPEGVTLEALRARGWVKSPPPPAAPGASGARLRIAVVPRAAARPPEPHLLRLLTPKGHYFMNTSFANMPRHRRGMRRPTLEMHPEDATARGLADGEHVRVRNGRGHVDAWLSVTTDVVRGVASLAGKWWAEPAVAGGVANALSPSAWSPGGQPAYNDTFVEVVRAPPADGPRGIGAQPAPGPTTGGADGRRDGAAVEP